MTTQIFPRTYYASFEGVCGNTTVQSYSDPSEMARDIADSQNRGLGAARISKRIYNRELRLGAEDGNKYDQSIESEVSGT